MKVWARVGMSIDLPDDLDLSDAGAVEAATKAAIRDGHASVDGNTYFPDTTDNPEDLRDLEMDIDPMRVAAKKED